MEEGGVNYSQITTTQEPKTPHLHAVMHCQGARKTVCSALKAPEARQGIPQLAQQVGCSQPAAMCLFDRLARIRLAPLPQGHQGQLAPHTRVVGVTQAGLRQR